MCHLYVSADPILYESRTRSLRIHGMATSIRLENLFWDVLSEIAGQAGITTNQLIIKLHDEVLELRGDLPNLASFLRVSCMRHLAARTGRRDGALEAGGRPDLRLLSTAEASH